MVELIFRREADALRCQKHLGAPSWIKETRIERSSHYAITIEAKTGREMARMKTCLTTFIINEMWKGWTEEALRTDYYYDDPEEVGQICAIISEMRSGERPELTELLTDWDEWGHVLEEVQNLLGHPAPVTFDAFATFRLKKLQDKWREMLGLAIDEYKMEQEYQVFIQMLREYLASRGQRTDTIHLYPSRTGFRFFDGHYAEVTKEELMNAIDKRLFFQHPLYVDSSTIAPLLSLAPRSIFVYGSEEEKIVTTLRNIFEDRLDILPVSYFPDPCIPLDLANE
ncbi:sporulation protein YtxC [Rossellomorea sp. FS2]|uniref:sporulation protein YtxC n=1 Tax=Rossellomorea sp. FS2 TaxID=3391447 RepID=UPI003A4D9516